MLQHLATHNQVRPICFRRKVIDVLSLEANTGRLHLLSGLFQYGVGNIARYYGGTGFRRKDFRDVSFPAAHLEHGPGRALTNQGSRRLVESAHQQPSQGISGLVLVAGGSDNDAILN